MVPVMANSMASLVPQSTPTDHTTLGLSARDWTGVKH